MTDSTTEQYWAADGVSLQTLAWNISSWGGDRQAPPPLRGDNITVPYAIGQKWYPKVADSRSITLNMWVEGCNSDGTIPDTGLRRRLFEDNFDSLRALMWDPSRQFNLTKQLRIPGTSTIIPVTARAQYQDGFAPSMFGTHMAQFSVTLFLADPYFYGALTPLPVGSNQTVLGHAPTEDLIVTLPAGKTLTNSNTGVAVTNNGSKTLTLDVRNFKAMDTSTNPDTPRGGDISHVGSKYWMSLLPGTQKLTGSGTVQYRARWF